MYFSNSPSFVEALQEDASILSSASRRLGSRPCIGMWKCRHCSWNYRMESPGMDHVHSHEEFIGGVVNGKTLSQLGSCFFSPSKGTESTGENAWTDFSTVGHANAENNHGNGEVDVEIKNLDILNGLESADKNLPQKVKINGLQSCSKTPQKDVADSAQTNFESVEITCIDGKSPLNMKSESRLDSKSIYSEVYGESGMSALEPVKGVIDGSSHGILVHNGKAIVEMDVERVLEEQDTHDLYCPNCNSCITKRVILRKREGTIGDDPSGTRTEPILQTRLIESPAATNEASDEAGPDVFRCLSCFSIFILTVTDGFKSFWIFRRNNQGRNLQIPQPTHANNLGWISAFFEPLRDRNTRNEPVVSDRQPVKGDVNEEQKHLGVKNNSNDFASPFSETPLVTHGQNSSGKVPQVGGNMSIPGVQSPNGVLITDKRPQESAVPAVPGADSMLDAEEGIVSTVSTQNNQTLSSPPASGIPSGSHKKSTKIGTSTGRQTIVNIGVQDVDTTRRHEWDILKSIVYGGLVESVTSLGVVSSAAGSDANTLNIVALGLANLIGGLFVIAHNLTEIRKEQVAGTDQNEERLDRYQETLGRRENFRRHVFAAVLSYIIFGLIPPTVYGFSFRKSDNKEYKMIAVAAASLACIALLAIGKAHVGRTPRSYAKTLFYYISTGVTASGLSYVAGELLNQLLEKLGLFNSRSDASPASLFLDYSSSTRLAAGWASS